MSHPSRLALPRLLLAALCLGAVPGAAVASGSAASEHGSKSATAGAEPAAPVQGFDPRVVNIAVLMAPVVDQGRLSGYLYLSVRLKAVTETGAAKIKVDLPLIQDAFLRALYARPIERKVAESEAVEAALAADLKAASTSLIDEASLEALEVLSVVRVPL
jgi:hypothetical protein